MNQPGVLICKERYARRLVGYWYDRFCRTVVGNRENEELPMRKGDCERQSDSEDSASKGNVSLGGRLEEDLLGTLAHRIIDALSVCDQLRMDHENQLSLRSVNIALLTSDVGPRSLAL